MPASFEKSAFATTEFWVMAASGASAYVVNSHLFPATGWEVKTASVVFAGLSAAMYIKGRSDLKTTIAAAVLTPPPPPAIIVAPAAQESGVRSQGSGGSRGSGVSMQAIPPLTSLVAAPPSPYSKAIIPGLIVLAAMFLAGCGGLGCSTACPQLSVYREGLHKVDQPMYAAHLQLLDDAIKAGIRTPVEKQIIQAGINGAESLYTQSVATEQNK